MTSRILTACAMAALTVGTQAIAQELPTWNPQTICTEDATPDHCGFLEGQARAQISQQWGFIPALVREQCLTSSEEDGTQSWRSFGGCLADASRAPGSGGTQVAAAAGGGDASGDDGSAEIASLRAELEAARTRIDELSQNAAGSDESQARITELETELDKAMTLQRSGETRIEGLQQRLVAAIDAQDGASGESAAQMETLQASLDKAIARARGAEFRSNALQGSLVAALASAKEAQASAGDATNDRIAELEAELAKANTETQRGASRIEGLQSRLMAMSDADAGGGSDDSAARIATLESALADAQAENERGAGRIAGLQQRLLSARNAAAEAAEANEAIASGTADADARITELEAALAKSETEVKRSTSRIEGLQQRLIEAADAADQQGEAPSGDGSAEIASLKGRLSDAEDRIENLSNRLRNSRTAANEAEREKARLESNLDNARMRIGTLQDAMIEMRRVSQEKEAMMADADPEAAQKAANLQRLLDNQRDRAQRVAATVSSQRARLQALESEVSTLRRTAETAGAISCQQRMGDIVNSGGIQFANNKAEIRADAARTIDQLIAIARDCDGARITVRGHTDSMGERDYNLYLSQLRADAVVSYMTRNGIAPDSIEAVGVGPDEPIADNTRRSGRAQNRRIEILVR